jgi:hypothetical protein
MHWNARLNAAGKQRDGLGLAFLKRYAKGRTEKKARVLTCPSSYRLSHFLAMYTPDHLALP